MIIKNVLIRKFRGFTNVQLPLGKHLTAIAGQNGTQKTTLLGIITQPFTISDKTNPLYGEKPLCGGNFKSLFGEKFKLSELFDLPRNHEWTLHLHNGTEFTVESIKRDSSQTGIRFWKKGDRKKGAGYIQLPVIYLSLSRLFPIGEDSKVNSSNQITLTQEEREFYQKWHNKILLTPEIEITGIDYLASKNKNTLGANTSFYDWKANSAGQDNIGKILLAILSFKRLKEKHKSRYQGGILAIDELDATLYTASQLKLLDALRKFSSQYKIQIIFTTHSLTILERACQWQDDVKLKDQAKVIFLRKVDTNIRVWDNISYEVMKSNLNVTLLNGIPQKKIPVFTEDQEGKEFFKALIKRKASVLSFNDCTLGCSNLIELVRKNIIGFRYPDSLIVLDGDVKGTNTYKNILKLPGNKSPERLIADLINSWTDESPNWSIFPKGYSKQYVFQEYSLKEIHSDREKAKEWYKSQKENWGTNCTKIINLWIKENHNEVERFLEDFNNKSEELSKYIS